MKTSEMREFLESAKYTIASVKDLSLNNLNKKTITKLYDNHNKEVNFEYDTIDNNKEYKVTKEDARNMLLESLREEKISTLALVYNKSLKEITLFNLERVELEILNILRVIEKINLIKNKLNSWNLDFEIYLEENLNFSTRTEISTKSIKINFHRDLFEYEILEVNNIVNSLTFYLEQVKKEIEARNSLVDIQGEFYLKQYDTRNNTVQDA